MPTLTPQQVEEAARAMPDHTLATSFLEPNARARVVALILFAHEIARARAVVSEAGLAAIRLQWWRDTIEQIYSGQVVRAQPTAMALATTIKEANLPRGLFDAMIEGYACELDDAPFETWADLEAYLDATSANLSRLSLLASGLPAITSSIDQAARHSGIAWGLSHLLASTPSWLNRRCLWFPKVAIGDLDREALFGGQVTQELVTILNAVKARIRASRDLTNTSVTLAKLGTHFPVLAHACLSMGYAKVASPSIAQTWTVKPEMTLLRRQLAITLAVARGRI